MGRAEKKAGEINARWQAGMSIATPTAKSGELSTPKSTEEPMRHDCRGGGWLTKIADAIELAADGDTLVVALARS